MSKKATALDNLDSEINSLCEKYGITHFYFAHGRPGKKELKWGSTSNSHNGSLLEFLSVDQIEMWVALVNNAYEDGKGKQ